MQSFLKENMKRAFEKESVKEYSSYYLFGKDYFGPFLWGFTQWLYMKLKQVHISRVYFFSRDGYMMDLAFRQLGYNTEFDTQYVHFSRKSLRQALLCTTSGYQESLQYLGWEKYVTLSKLLEYYGYDTCERKNLSELYIWELSKEYAYDSLKENIEVEQIYTLLQSQINEKSKKQIELLSEYIKQIGMNGPCAIVDIGWHGSMQYCVEQLLKLNGLDSKIYGYYIGISPQFPICGLCDGYLYNSQNLKLRKSVLCSLGILERLLQSTEGSTDGYMKVGDMICPVYRDYEYKDDPKLIYYIKEWQKGALDYVEQRDNSAFKDADYVKYAHPLINFGKNPTLKDVKLFSSFYNIDGMKEYYVSQKKLVQYKPRELMRELSNSVWKTGFLKSVFKIPFPYFLIYRIFRK